MMSSIGRKYLVGVGSFSMVLTNKHLQETSQRCSEALFIMSQQKNVQSPGYYVPFHQNLRSNALKENE